MLIDKKIAYFTDKAVPSVDEQAEIDDIEARLYVSPTGNMDDHSAVHVRVKNFKLASMFGAGELYGATTEDFDAVAAFYDDIPSTYEGSAFPLVSDAGIEDYFIGITPSTSTVDTTLQLYATAHNGVSYTDITTAGTWISSSTGTATVGAHTGLVTAIAGETAEITITCTYKGHTGTKVLSVI